jgi:raffinose/stachyose/melibiose transport system permease protein
MFLQRKREQNGLIFILPALFVYTFVIGFPSLMTIIYAFTDWRMGTKPHFIALDNFKKMFSEAEWVVRLAIKNNIVWMMLMLIINISLALIVTGLLKNVSNTIRQFMRMFFYIPVILPRTVVCRIWMWLFNPFVGLSAVLSKWNIPFLGIGDPDTVLFSIAAVGAWCWWGFPLVIFLSALQQIDPIYYEAAKLEGAGPVSVFVRITIPMIRPTLIFVVILTVITSFQIFDLIYIITWGGPGRSSEVLATLIYKYGILQFQSGYASALAILQIFISSIGIIAYIYTQKKNMEEV